MKSFNPFNRKIGLALGGGGAKGIAHIGVLNSLIKSNVHIDYLSGTSAGAVVASYFAFGNKLEQLDEIRDILRIQALINLKFSKMGLMSSEKLEKLLLDSLGDVRIEDAKIPLAICTTDINTGESVYHQTGRLIPALCASCAVPGIITPVQIDGRLLVDGGISNNVPIDILNDMGAGITIGVDLNGASSYPTVDSIVDILANSIDIAIDLRTRSQLQKADIVISLDLQEFSRVDNNQNLDKLVTKAQNCTDKIISRLFRNRILRILYTAKDLIKELLPFKFKWPFSQS